MRIVYYLCFDYFVYLFKITRWQQLLINRFVGYDTILINSLLSSPGQGNKQIFFPFIFLCVQIFKKVRTCGGEDLYWGKLCGASGLNK